MIWGTQAPVEAGSAKQDIEFINSEIVRAYNAKDISRIVSFYSDDLILLPPRQAMAKGRESARKNWEETLEAQTFDFSQSIVEIEESGDFAFSVGVFDQKFPGDGGKTTHVVGKFIDIFRKEADGNWRIYREIWNADSITILD
jgi:ketosteroid isomerase-like protein